MCNKYIKIVSVRFVVVTEKLWSAFAQTPGTTAAVVADALVPFDLFSEF